MCDENNEVIYRRSGISDQKLIDTVKRIAQQLDRPPKTTEVRQYQTIIRRWKGLSWAEFLMEVVQLGSSPSRTPKFTDNELTLIVREAKTFLNKQGKTFSIENYKKLRTITGKKLPSHTTIDRRVGWQHAKRLPPIENQFVLLKELSPKMEKLISSLPKNRFY